MKTSSHPTPRNGALLQRRCLSRWLMLTANKNAVICVSSKDNKFDLQWAKSEWTFPFPLPARKTGTHPILCCPQSCLGALASTFKRPFLTNTLTHQSLSSRLLPHPICSLPNNTTISMHLALVACPPTSMWLNPHLSQNPCSHHLSPKTKTSQLSLIEKDPFLHPSRRVTMWLRFPMAHQKPKRW